MKKWLKTTLKLTVTTALLVLVFLKIDLGQLLGSVRLMDPMWLLYSAAAYFAAVLVLGYKWLVLLPGYGYIKLLNYSFVGLYYSMALPGQLSGDVVKAYKFAKGRENAEEIAASVVIDKLTGIIALLILACAGIAVSSKRPPAALIAGTAALLAILVIALFLLRFEAAYGLITGLLDKISKNGPGFEKVVISVKRMLSSYRDYSKKHRVVVKSVLVGIVFQSLCAFILVLLSKATGVSVGFYDWCWINGALSVLLLLPVTVAGLGLREGGMAGLLGLMGVPVERAVVISLLLFSLQILGALTGWAIDAYNMMIGKKSATKNGRLD